MIETNGFAQYWAQGDAARTAWPTCWHHVAHQLVLHPVQKLERIPHPPAPALEGSGSPDPGRRHLRHPPRRTTEDVYAPLAIQSAEAPSQSSKRNDAPSLNAATDPGELITRTLPPGINRVSSRLENG